MNSKLKVAFFDLGHQIGFCFTDSDGSKTTLRLLVDDIVNKNIENINKQLVKE